VPVIRLEHDAFKKPAANSSKQTPRESVAAMMSQADRRKAADILLAAEKERKQAVQLSKTWPSMTIEDAYAISTEVVERKIDAGAKLIGHKVGLTSKAM
jgi:2-oxo-hept-3-ene-1,7-dioate hydratase